MSGLTAGANWNTSSYISNSKATSVDPSQSFLKSINSDDNCFITPSADFQMVAQYIPPAVNGTQAWVLEHYNHAQALSAFGFDPDSAFMVQSNPSAIFTDPAAHEYNLIDQQLCQNMGYFAYNENLTFGIQDFLSLNLNWLKKILVVDVINDGVVNNRDLGTMMSKWQ